MGCATADEINRFAIAADAHHPSELHFYVDVDDPFEAIGAL
jgi:hypothetical protein